MMQFLKKKKQKELKTVLFYTHQTIYQNKLDTKEWIGLTKIVSKYKNILKNIRSNNGGNHRYFFLEGVYHDSRNR